MAKKDEEKQAKQNQSQAENQAAQEPKEEENPATPTNYVEDSDGNRAAATPDDDPAAGRNDGLPEGTDYVGLLETQVNPDPVEEQLRQQQENYPRLPEEYFDPTEHEPEEARVGAASTSRSSKGRWLVVENDVLYEGEVIKAGVDEYPSDVADALLSRGDAFEPAGKKGGR